MSERRQTFDFFEMGIEAGEELVSVRDSTIKVQVKNERQVTYNNKDYYLTGLNDELGFPNDNCRSWLYRGKCLEDIYEETYPKEEDKLEKYKYPTNYYRMQMKHSNGDRIAEEMIDKKLITAALDYAGEDFNVLQKGDVILVHKGSNLIALVSVIAKQTELDESSFGVDYSVDVLKDYRENKTNFKNIPFSGTFQSVLNSSTPIYKFIDKEYLSIIGGENMQQSNLVEEYIALLKANHNIILHGAPGTGKTYLAKEIAKAMGCTKNEIGFVQFHPSYDYTDFVEGLRPVNSDDRNSIGFERKDGVFKEFCERAAKNLSDSKKSIETIKKEQTWQERFDNFVNDEISNPTSRLTTITGNEFYIEDRTEDKLIISIPKNERANKLTIDIFEIMELLTKEVNLDSVGEIKNYFNRKWRSQNDSYTFIVSQKIRETKNDIVNEPVNTIPRKPFVFIIDEINRGEMSKIFGELFFSIDPSYRGFDDDGQPKGLVQTQYQNLVTKGEFVKGFYVPENVYIIGTMNDIDRSVESMDFAMRRRFIFKEITAAESAVNMKLSDEATRRMANLNNAISNIEGLNSSYHIGSAYFQKEVEIDGEMKRVSVESGDFDNLWKLKLEPLLKEYLRGMEDADKKLGNLETEYNKD